MGSSPLSGATTRNAFCTPFWVGVIIGNTIEAGADMGGIAEALRTAAPLPHAFWVIALGVVASGALIWSWIDH